MKVRFVLVEPRSEENIGAAARALKTMGFNQLYLVNPQTEIGKTTDYVAHGSEDIIQQVQLVETLETALLDCDLIVGTTRPNRNHAQPFLSGEKLKQYVFTENAGAFQQVAIVFGPERTGLTTEHLNLCDVLSFIPLAQQRPALNLAQAVMIYSYLFSPVAGSLAVQEKDGPVLEQGEKAALKREVLDLAVRFGFDHNHSNIQKLISKIHMCAPHNIRFFHHLVQRVKKHLNHADS